MPSPTVAATAEALSPLVADVCAVEVVSLVGMPTLLLVVGTSAGDAVVAVRVDIRSSLEPVAFV